MSSNKIGYDGEKHSSKKFSILTATVFIIGEVAGGGILSLPYAVSLSGWSGIITIIFCAFCAGLSGLYLAKSWNILEERYPEYQNGLTRKPFATIGFHAFGPYMSASVSIIMNITRIGTTTVFFLLTSGFIETLTSSFTKLNICSWIPIVGAILLIPSWLGSPADFWPMAYTAMLSSLFGSALLMVTIIRILYLDGFASEYHSSGLKNFFTSFGTILFAYGGASAFPNFQNDMKHKEKFPIAVIFGLILLYVPVSALGYAAFGHSTQSLIIENIWPTSDHTQSTLITIIRICFFIHCLTVTLIIANPVFLDLEELFKIPKSFCWKRCLFRTAMLVFNVFLGETFPNFGQILGLIGGSTVALMAFVLPPIFYIKLCNEHSNETQDFPKKKVPWYLITMFGIVICSGIIGSIASTYSNLSDWSSIKSACYLSH